MAGLGVFDPRQQAHTSLTYKSEQPQLTATKSFEQSQLFATRKPGDLTSTAKPGKQPQTSDLPYFSRQRTELETAVHPPFLDKNSKWDQQGLPTLMTLSQAQPLTTTGKLDGTRGLTQAPRAISAVHSYHDISPVLTTEYTRDTDKAEVTWDATLNKQGTHGVYTPGLPAHATAQLGSLSSLQAGRNKPMTKPGTVGDPAARKSSVDDFWHRNGSDSHLKQPDVIRVGDELGKHSVPGSPNAKLIAGKWRYLSRPAEGTHLYTDFYGRNGDKHCDYYGRTYHYLPQ